MVLSDRQANEGERKPNQGQKRTANHRREKKSRAGLLHSNPECNCKAPYRRNCNVGADAAAHHGCDKKEQGTRQYKSTCKQEFQNFDGG